MPGFAATTRYRNAIAQTLRRFDADPKRQAIDDAADAKRNRLIAYDRGLAAVRREFA